MLAGWMRLVSIVTETGLTVTHVGPWFPPHSGKYSEYPRICTLLLAFWWRFVDLTRPTSQIPSGILGTVDLGLMISIDVKFHWNGLQTSYGGGVGTYHQLVHLRTVRGRTCPAPTVLGASRRA